MRGERGFSLIESAIVVGLIALGVGGALDALLLVTHQRAVPASDALLQASARNLINDLSAATAYESAASAGQFSLGAGTAVTMAQPVPGGTPVVIACTPSMTRGILTVTCTDGTGRSASAQAFVGQRAPAPGSTTRFLPPSTPAP